MPASNATRLARLSDATRERWEKAWDALIDDVYSHLPDRALQLIADGAVWNGSAEPLTGADAEFVVSLYAEAGLTLEAGDAFNEWGDELGAAFAACDAGDLTAWPHAIASPPAEPPGVYAALRRALGAASEAPPDGGTVPEVEIVGERLALLAIARAVRGARGEPVPPPEPEPGVIRVPGSGVRIKVINSPQPPPEP